MLGLLKVTFVNMRLLNQRLLNPYCTARLVAPVRLGECNESDALVCATRHKVDSKTMLCKRGSDFSARLN